MILSEKGVERVELDTKPPSKLSLWLNKFTKNWMACFVSRELYWEKVVSYPTHNLLEIKNIVAAELRTISPINGKTTAYLISIKNNTTYVLYCCMPTSVLSMAHKKQLKRLLPISLPFYRQLAQEYGDYFISIDNSDTQPSQDGSMALAGSKFFFLLSNNASTRRTLPVGTKLTDSALAYHLSESKEISKFESKKILYSWHFLSLTDWFEPIREHVETHKNSISTIGKFSGLSFVSFLIAFILFESVFLTLENRHLKGEIANNRLEAGETISASEEIRKINGAITQINEIKRTHLPKSILLKLFSDVAKQTDGLVFNLIEIYREDIRLRGNSDSATHVLSLLVKQSGFFQVEFSSPPVTQKNGMELFDIKLKYDASYFIEERESDQK